MYRDIVSDIDSEAVFWSGNVEVFRSRRALEEGEKKARELEASGGHSQILSPAELASLLPVDYVVVFAGDSPGPLLAELQPDVHCKGTDYISAEGVPEHEIVAAYGGRTAIVGDPKDHATSDLISRVKNLPD